MPVTPINPVTAPHVYVPMQRQKSERETMAENGGHVYYEVHLAQCPECRAVEKKRHEENVLIFGWLIKLTILVVAVGFLICYRKGIRSWFSKMKTKLIMSEKELSRLDRLCLPWSDWKSSGPEEGPSRLAWRHKIMVERLEVIKGYNSLADTLYYRGYNNMPERCVMFNPHTELAHYIHFTHDKSSCKVDAFLLPKEILEGVKKRFKEWR